MTFLANNNKSAPVAEIDLDSRSALAPENEIPTPNTATQVSSNMGLPQGPSAQANDSSLMNSLSTSLSNKPSTETPTAIAQTDTPEINPAPEENKSFLQNLSTGIINLAQDTKRLVLEGMKLIGELVQEPSKLLELLKSGSEKPSEILKKIFKVKPSQMTESELLQIEAKLVEVLGAERGQVLFAELSALGEKYSDIDESDPQKQEALRKEFEDAVTQVLEQAVPSDVLETLSVEELNVIERCTQKCLGHHLGHGSSFEWLGRQVLSSLSNYFREKRETISSFKAARAIRELISDSETSPNADEFYATTQSSSRYDKDPWKIEEAGTIADDPIRQLSNRLSRQAELETRLAVQQNLNKKSAAQEDDLRPHSEASKAVEIATKLNRIATERGDIVLNAETRSKINEHATTYSEEGEDGENPIIPFFRTGPSKEEQLLASSKARNSPLKVELNRKFS